MGVAVSQEYPVTNMVAPSWSDITFAFNLDGATTRMEVDIKEIKWSSKVEVGEQRGASGGRVLKRTTGAKTDEGSAVFYRSGLRSLIASLATAAPTRGIQKLVGMVPFTVVVLHTPPGSDEIFQVELRGCRLLGLDSTSSEGTDAETVAVDLAPIEVVQVEAGSEIVLI